MVALYPHGRVTMPGRLKPWALVLPFLAVFVVLGGIGVYRYVDNYWLYRGFAPPRDAAWVTQHGLWGAQIRFHAARLYSWMRPPRRSRRVTSSGRVELAGASVGCSWSGGVSHGAEPS